MGGIVEETQRLIDQNEEELKRLNDELDQAQSNNFIKQNELSQKIKLLSEQNEQLKDTVKFMKGM